MNSVLAFLSDLYSCGLHYSALNTARSAISSVFSVTKDMQIGNSPLIRRFMRGVFNKRPSLPRYNCTWDVGNVLSFITSWPENHVLDLKRLSMKTAILLLLVMGQRCQTVHLIDIRNLELGENYLKIRIAELVKQSRPNRGVPEFYIESFNSNSQVCVVQTIRCYLDKTRHLRADTCHQLFVATQKPHQAVSRATISRWVKQLLVCAGIDMTIFKPHSTRSASTSKAATKVSLDTVLRTAGWRSDCTFRKFYNRPVTNDGSYSRAVLQL